VITFGLDFLNPVAIILERNITQLIESGKKYDINDIIKKIQADKNADKKDASAAIGLMEAAKTWGVFASKKQESVKIKDIVNPLSTTVIDLSAYSSLGTFNVRALVIGLLCKKLFNERMDARKKEEIESVKRGMDYLNYTEKRKMPMVWILIDEAHEFLPKDVRDKTAATDPLVQILREGRQPGITLVLATQQPGQIHKDVMTQSDIVLSHRVTASFDIEALNMIMQNYTTGGISSYLNNLPRLKGSAIVLDDNSERIYPMRVRPRFTWHGGEAPTAINVEKRF
jgi:DNA helicase HerA-like ATPase